MGVHEYIKPIVLGYPQDLNRVLYELLVVSARARRFDGFPRENIADGIEAVSLYPRKMHPRILFGKGALVEGYVIAVEEVVANKGREVGLARQFSIASDVDATEHDLPSMVVAELGILDYQTKRSHGLRDGCPAGGRFNGVDGES